MQKAAEKQGVQLAWVQVDKVGTDKINAALQNAHLVIIDAPRTDDIAAIERSAGDALKSITVPMLQISMMNPPERLKPVQIDSAVAERLFDYYAGGTPINHERLFQYLNAMLTGGDVAKVAEPMKLPNGGIYHPKYPELIFANLPDYLAWQVNHGKTRL